MCARFRSIKDWASIPAAWQAARRLNFEVNANVAPTETVPMLTNEDGDRIVRLARFGITQTRAGKSFPLLNMRTDSIRRGSFKSGYRARRCVIPAAGFYEWRPEEGGKQPYIFERVDGLPILFAGIWDRFENKGDTVTGFAIVTDEPNEFIAQFHDRMPFILEDAAAWTDRDNPLDTVQPLPAEAFQVRPMNRAMNKPTVKDPALIEG